VWVPGLRVPGLRVPGMRGHGLRVHGVGGHGASLPLVRDFRDNGLNIAQNGRRIQLQ